MKITVFGMGLILLFSCNNTGGKETNSAGLTQPDPKNEPVSGPAVDCGNSLYFKKGAKMATKTTDGKGKVLSVSESTVSRVYTEGNMLVAEMQMESSDEAAGKTRSMKGIYRCDGTNMLMDLSSFIDNTPGMKISSTGIPFPLNLRAGETLPEVRYTVTVTNGGKEMKINSTIKDRKVEDVQPVTVTAGTFNCYKIHASIDASPEMEGMTEQQRQAMDKMKETMPKNTMIIWFDPEIAVVKMEVYMGKNLLSRTELSSISK